MVGFSVVICSPPQIRAHSTTGLRTTPDCPLSTAQKLESLLYSPPLICLFDGKAGDARCAPAGPSHLSGSWSGVRLRHSGGGEGLSGMLAVECPGSGRQRPLRLVRIRPRRMMTWNPPQPRLSRSEHHPRPCSIVGLLLDGAPLPRRQIRPRRGRVALVEASPVAGHSLGQPVELTIGSRAILGTGRR